VGDNRFRISGVHITHGGHPLAAQLCRHYGNDTGFWSHLWQANDPAQFEALCLLAAEYDLRVHTIASTFAQIPHVVESLERVHAQYDLRGRRWVVEHVSVCKPEYFDTFERLGIGVTLLPAAHLWKGGTRFHDLPEADADYLVPAKPLMERGVPVAGGTDNTPYDPLLIMRAFMLREERTTGRVFGPRARLDAEQALTAMTAAGAWFTFEESVKGRLLPGYFADCAVLSENPLAVPPRDYANIACVATMVGGTFVHRT
jgi:predicted amidohydrolase YtcJ